jgi:[acyl-carrier-protein] S-malonyltransferase
VRVLACPGQGSQSAGFLQPWLAELPGLRSRLDLLSQASGIDLIELGTVADEATIKGTANAQPLIVGASIAIARELFGEEIAGFEGVVGHSVGEFAAAALAGVLSDSEAMSLVSTRARAMARASALEPTSMAAVIGLEQEAAEHAASQMGLTVANYNGGGQFVVAGRSGAIAALVANPPAGSRIIELKVAGAFHTEFMAPAVGELELAAAQVSPADPRLTLWSNKDGQRLTSGQEALGRLVSQVASPVRFDLCLASLGDCTEFVELPPAGALSGLAKRSLSASVVALKNPADVSKVGAQ